MPDGLDALAEVIEDMAALDATASREETADNAGDVLADVECLGIIHTNTLYAKTETADAWEHDCLTLRKPLLQDVLQFRHYTNNGSLAEAAVATSLGGYLIERDLALTDCFSKIFSIRTAALDVVLD
jgi:hypothetical protein